MTLGTVLQVVGVIQKVPASGPQLQAALNAFQQALEKSCDADELERQRRRSSRRAMPLERVGVVSVREVSNDES